MAKLPLTQLVKGISGEDSPSAPVVSRISRRSRSLPIAVLGMIMFWLKKQVAFGGDIEPNDVGGSFIN